MLKVVGVVGHLRREQRRENWKKVGSRAAEPQTLGISTPCSSPNFVVNNRSKSEL